jgi:isopenicillin N synthase-like dioxygenase
MLTKRARHGNLRVRHGPRGPRGGEPDRSALCDDAQVSVPIIDVAALYEGDPAPVAHALDQACRRYGFFYVVGHRVPPALIRGLEAEARAFFALPVAAKAEIEMARGGRAWRGWFPVGGELTSGEPDVKEGLYLGLERGPDDPHVRAGTPLFGPNLWPSARPGLRPAVLQYLEEVTALGQRVLEGLALALGLERTWFRAHVTHDPLVLFRLFHYPADDTRRWGVGEHTDYGLLTLLAQDDAGGLEVHTPDGWRAAPPVAGSFVCNLGDMLERMTRGHFVSTPHRVRNTSGRARLSMPLFLDPAWDSPLVPVPGLAPPPLSTAARTRWDGASVHDFQGTYGDYVRTKVARVFPALAAAVG